jgi:hypothetical protein
LILKFFLHRGGRPHMPVRHGGATPLSFQGAASQPGHLGRCAGLVDEDQSLRIKIRLGCEPSLAPGCDVGPRLLGCVRCFMEWPALLPAG